jgi:hypothetical protein
MDCLRSFSVVTSGNANFAPPAVKTWTLGAQEFWQVNESLTSYFVIQGFKNINIFGVDVIGSVYTLTSAPLIGGCVVSDWSVRVDIDGQIPLIGGVIDTVPDDWSIDTSSSFVRQFPLGRFTNSVKFSSPFESVRRVGLLGLNANGTGGQTINNVNLAWHFNFVFHYKFEGE